MEVWDLYDENRRPLGRTHRRGEPLPAGSYHLGVDIWTVNARGEILLTLRAPEKDDLPNEWENTCGSVLAGETSLQGALRELREETGIVAGPEELEWIDSRCGGRDCLSDSYLLRRDVELGQLVFQAGETVDAMWVTPAKLEEMIARPEGARPVGSRWPFVREKLLERLGRSGD